MQPFFQGILIGLTITISIGPGALAIFQTSITRGAKAGFVLATGILVSDLTLISICYFGLSELSIKEKSPLLGVIAGLILIFSGAISIFRKPTSTVDFNNSENTGLKNHTPVLLVKGFLINITNPFVSIFWIGMMGFAAANYGMHSYALFIFFIGLILTAFSSDLLKSFLSSFFKKILVSKTIAVINKLIGVAFIGMGFFIIGKVLI